MFSDIIDNGFVIKDKANALLQSEAKTFGYKDMQKFKAMFLKRVDQGRMIPNVVYSFVDRDKSRTILESECRPLRDMEKLHRRYYEKGFSQIVYDLKNGELNIRILSKSELCKLQGFPGDYCDIITRNQAASLLGDGWSLPMIEHILSFINPTP